MPGYELQRTNLAAIGKNIWLGAVVESSTWPRLPPCQ